MKKGLINMALVALVFVIYFLQSNFFNWFTIAGVMPNLFIIFVLFVGLFTNRVMGVIYGVLIGIFLDAVIGKQIGITAVILGVIGFIAATFDKNFSKDSRVTMMFMVFVTTMIFEIASYIINYIIFGINVEIFAFIKILIIEIIYNLAIVIIIYPLMKMFGYFIENEYKGNRILTRYF